MVYSTTARLGGKAEFDTMLKLHNKTDSSEEKLNFTAALNSFKQPELIAKALKQIKSKDVRLQDVPYWVAYAFSNYHGRDLAWEWLKDNWQWLEDNLGSDLSFFRIPLYVARCYSDKAFLEEYKDFFNQNPSVALERPLNQGVETIEWQSEWRDRDLDKIKKFFKA